MTPTPNFLVFDNFYNNVHEVREFALTLPFTVTGNYPGARTRAMLGLDFNNCKTMMENIMGCPITYWPADYNTAFQYTDQNAKTWIHHDATQWAGVLYLTPDAPLDSGTAIYRNNATGVYRWNPEDDTTDYNNDAELIADYSRWTPIVQVANLYNRLVVYRGELYHSSVVAGFGNNPQNGRLFQTFFFNT